MPDSLYFTNVDNNFAFYRRKANSDSALLDVARQLWSHKLKTITCRFYVMTQSYSCMSALNIRSLAAHTQDIQHYYILRHSSPLCLAQMWMDLVQLLDIVGYKFCCSTWGNHSRAAGVVIYLRDCLSALPIKLFTTSDGLYDLCAVTLENDLIVVSAYLSLLYIPMTSCTSCM